MNHVQLFLLVMIFSICYVSRIAYLFKKNYIRNKFVFIELLLYEIIIHIFIIFFLEKLRYNVSSLHDVFYIYIYIFPFVNFIRQAEWWRRSCQAQEDRNHALLKRKKESIILYVSVRFEFFSSTVDPTIQQIQIILENRFANFSTKIQNK